MSRVANDARFWDRIARKYAADPIADRAGYERTLERARRGKAAVTSWPNATTQMAIALAVKCW